MLCVAMYSMFFCQFLGFFSFLFSSDGCFVSLTQNTVQFAKSSLQLVDDLLRLYTIELETLIGVAIETVFNAQMMQFQAALKAEKFQADVSWICCHFWWYFLFAFLLRVVVLFFFGFAESPTFSLLYCPNITVLIAQRHCVKTEYRKNRVRDQFSFTAACL